ncbi:polynucleotide adenylyltransferase PcnB [Chlamydiales bacterium]|nr:polynucleotide adenylyltransferase PcnB [Chlamydiales bacterium]
MQPQTYPFQEHQIDQNKIDRDALYVILKLQEKGFNAYLVGGGVRDLLCKKSPKDFDISTNAKPEEIKTIFKRRCILIGRRFRLAHVRFDHKIIEVSTFRSQESKDGELIVSDNEWGSEEEDAFRRDFTINGLFYDPKNQLVIDYVGGYEDLKRNTLCCIGDPVTRFKEDPVRMIRLLKFEARFSFEIELKMLRVLEELQEEITKSAQARILEELLRMLESGYGAPFVRRMTELGLMKHISPPLASFLEGEESQSIYSFLEAADRIQLKFGTHALERTVICACLIYPVLKKKIDKISMDQQKPVHLGQITSETHDLIENFVSSSFSRFPKRLSMLMGFLIVNQWRLTPTSTRRYSRQKFLESHDFLPSLKFLKIRSLVYPEHQLIYKEWNEQYKTRVHHGDRTPHPHQFQKKRRRKPKRPS